MKNNFWKILGYLELLLLIFLIWKVYNEAGIWTTLIIIFFAVDIKFMSYYIKLSNKVNEAKFESLKIPIRRNEK